jgi:hypothetical protein
VDFPFHTPIRECLDCIKFSQKEQIQTCFSTPSNPSMLTISIINDKVYEKIKLTVLV